MKSLPVKWAGEELVVLADKALFWPREQMLILADPHFGKASSFRHFGVPVPVGTTASDIARLSFLVDHTAARRLVVLGDFFHHRTGQCETTMSALGAWRESRRELEITLVLGNHDRNSMPPPPEWRVEVSARPLPWGPFLLCHEPCRHEGHHVLSGHIHPAVKLRDTFGPALRLPCFLFSDGIAHFPAFGGFTGTAVVKPRRDDIIVALHEGQIFELSA